MVHEEARESMNNLSEPELTVVIATPDSYETIRKTMGYLRKQTSRHRMEIVIVTPSLVNLGQVKSELDEFLRCQIVEASQVLSISWAKAAGIRKATAPVVALAEDHVYPEPGWAEAFIKAHKQSMKDRPVLAPRASCRKQMPRMNLRGNP